MSKTEQNLKDAFAGESQANRKYLAYAVAAEKEGLKQVSKLFRAAAAAETIHAHAHWKNLGMIKDTAANLQDALEGETYEFTKMYPVMKQEAEAEGNTVAAKYFSWANAVEEVHANLYKKALENPAALADTDYYVCKVCGYTHEGACDKCPVCGAGAMSFFKVDETAL
jgi:rubrerythrin